MLTFETTDGVEIDIDYSIEDVGIGDFEFWGAPGCDTQLVPVLESATCNGISFDLEDLSADDTERAQEEATEDMR